MSALSRRSWVPEQCEARVQSIAAETAARDGAVLAWHAAEQQRKEKAKLLATLEQE